MNPPMASTDVDLTRLNESQQLALQTYTSVTNQEPSAGIPLLERSQWNVQVRAGISPLKHYYGRSVVNKITDCDSKLFRRGSFGSGDGSSSIFLPWPFTTAGKSSRETSEWIPYVALVKLQLEHRSCTPDSSSAGGSSRIPATVHTRPRLNANQYCFPLLHPFPWSPWIFLAVFASIILRPPPGKAWSKSPTAGYNRAEAFEPARYCCEIHTGVGGRVRKSFAQLFRKRLCSSPGYCKERIEVSLGYASIAGA